VCLFAQGLKSLFVRTITNEHDGVIFTGACAFRFSWRFTIRTSEPNEHTNGDMLNMRKTPVDIERDIVARVLEGESYEAAANGRVGKATVARVVDDLRKAVPDFDELRELNIRLKREGRLVSDVLQRMENMKFEQPIVLTVCSDSGEKNAAVEYLESVLADRRIWIPCKNCQFQIAVPLESAEFYEELLGRGHWLWIVCPRCGLQLQYFPLEILGHFALSLLKKDKIVVKLDPVPSLW
jgi:hypothetical protein